MLTWETWNRFSDMFFIHLTLVPQKKKSITQILNHESHIIEKSENNHLCFGQCNMWESSHLFWGQISQWIKCDMQVDEYHVSWLRGTCPSNWPAERRGKGEKKYQRFSLWVLTQHFCLLALQRGVVLDGID